MLSRPLVYTALTRARLHLSVVHAAGPALARAVEQIGQQPRRTRLQALLHGQPTSTLRHDRLRLRRCRLTSGILEV